ncbi:MAG TPA: hypothetical protein VK525_02740 [Candidatus Saccharimonadales bacterium]|nr:hypothetical protein [Candidatus Saccharimonadales bacterium]
MDFERRTLVLEQRSKCSGGKPPDASRRNDDNNGSPWNYDALHSREKISMRP